MIESDGLLVGRVLEGYRKIFGPAFGSRKFVVRQVRPRCDRFFSEARDLGWELVTLLTRHSFEPFHT